MSNVPLPPLRMHKVQGQQAASLPRYDVRRTFTQISEEIGLTNAYTAQLFHNQVGDKLHRAVLASSSLCGRLEPDPVTAMLTSLS